MTPAPRKLDEALGEALRAGKAPEALRQSLLAEARRRDAGRARAPRAWLAAAALVLTLGGGYGLVRALRPTPLPMASEGLPELLDATTRNYLTVKGLDFRGPDCTDKACGLWALRRVGFTAPVPAALAKTPLAGGRSCAVEGRPVAHYTFRDGRALYVFQAPFPGCSGDPTAPRAVEGQLLARAWNEQGRGYVLLEPHL